MNACKTNNAWRGPANNPDEQRRYLGTFRERVIAAVKKSQLNSPAIQAQFEATLKQHAAGKVLISQPLAGDLFTTYVLWPLRQTDSFALLSTNDGHETTRLPTAADQSR